MSLTKCKHNWIWWVDPQTGEEYWTCTECHAVDDNRAKERIELARIRGEGNPFLDALVDAYRSRMRSPK